MCILLWVRMYIINVIQYTSCVVILQYCFLIHTIGDEGFNLFWIWNCSFRPTYQKRFSQFVVTPTRCSINTMDVKIFPNTNMLLKVNSFEAFLNRSNVGELVISNMSECNCNNYKLNNKSVFFYTEYFLT